MSIPESIQKGGVPMGGGLGGSEARFPLVRGMMMMRVVMRVMMMMTMVMLMKMTGLMMMMLLMGHGAVRFD